MNKVWKLIGFVFSTIKGKLPPPSAVPEQWLVAVNGKGGFVKLGAKGTCIEAKDFWDAHKLNWQEPVLQHIRFRAWAAENELKVKLFTLRGE